MLKVMNDFAPYRRNWDTDVPPWHFIAIVLGAVGLFISFFLVAMTIIPTVSALAFLGANQYLYKNNINRTLDANQILLKRNIDDLSPKRQRELNMSISDIAFLEPTRTSEMLYKVREIASFDKMEENETKKHDPRVLGMLDRADNVVVDAEDSYEIALSVNKQMKELL